MSSVTLDLAVDLHLCFADRFWTSVFGQVFAGLNVLVEQRSRAVWLGACWDSFCMCPTYEPVGIWLFSGVGGTQSLGLLLHQTIPTALVESRSRIVLA